MADFDANFMQGPMDEIGLVKLSGSIERVIYANDENGYAICDLGTDTDELVTITGTLPYINGLTLSNAMHLSAWTGKTVELPFDEDLYYKLLMERVATSKVKTGGGTVADTEGSYD